MVRLFLSTASVPPPDDEGAFLRTSHPKICRFYATHSSIDFEMVNLLVVDMLDTLLFQTQDEETTAESLQTQMIQWMTDQSRSISHLVTSVSDLKQSVSSFHADTAHLSNTCMTQLLDFRKEYLDELKTIVYTQTSEQLRPLLEKNTHEWIEKTTVLLNEVKSPWFHQIQESIRFFHKSITDDTRQLLKQLDRDGNRGHELMALFEQKTAQVLVQPLSDMITSSEERILQAHTRVHPTEHHQVMQDLHDLVQQLHRSATATTGATVTTGPTGPPGQAGSSNSVQQIQYLLNQMYPMSDVERVSRPLGRTGSATAFVLKRPDGKPRLLVSHKDVPENLGDDDLQLFLHDLDHHGCHGVFLSAQSGFANKANYQIESHHGYLVIYVHSAEYNPDKIRLAVDVLDHLAVKWKEYGAGHVDGAVIQIDTELLEKIHLEHQAFITQKDTITQVMKENQRKVLAQLDDLRLPTLDRFLSTKFVVTSHKPGLLCNLCKHYYANNLKALAAHKRGCARKLGGPSATVATAATTLPIPPPRNTVM